MSDGVERDISAVQVLIPIWDLRPHPLNATIYGDGAESPDQRLVESIASLGILEPLGVEDRHPDGFRILSGHRRWRAAIAADLEKVPCRVIPPLNDEITEAEILIEANRQREKTFFQLMNEAAQLERIESEKAKRRQGTRTDLVEILPQSETGETGKTRDKVAEKIGMSGRTYDKAKKVFEKAVTGDETAQEQVKKLDAGIVGVENIPMNFNNDGFVFKFNEATKSKITPAIEAKVNEALAAFKGQAGHASVVNWSSVKYN